MYLTYHSRVSTISKWKNLNQTRANEVRDLIQFDGQTIFKNQYNYLYFRQQISNIDLECTINFNRNCIES